jgi:hypothetical protein
MSKNKMGKDLNESKLKKVSGGNITIIDRGNGRERYIASEKGYDPNIWGLGAGEFRGFRTFEEAEDYAKEKGWDTTTDTYKWGTPKQRGCIIHPGEKIEEKWLRPWE